MRIGYLSESMRWSGGAQQLIWMSDALKNRGHDLTLLVQPGSDLVEAGRKVGLPVELLRMRQDYDVPAAWRLSKKIKAMGLDLLHAQHSTAHAIGLMAAALSEVPVFCVTRRVIFPIKTNLFSRLKYLSQRIDGYVAISEAVREELLKVHIRPDHIQVIPSVVRPPTLDAREGTAVRQEFGIPMDAPVMTMVSNYSDFKGHEHFIRAAAAVVQAFPQTHFIVAGRDTEKLQGLVDSLGLTQAVHLARFRTDVPRLLAATTVFVMPSLQEAAGTSLREAMIVGLPCIGSRVGGIPESIEDGKTGLLVSPADPVALGNAMIRLLRAPEEARRMAMDGKAWIEAHFTLAPAAQRMETFYETLLSRTVVSPR
jgi:glycosyltransferase involved in cell wall biosynthesis